MVNWCNDWDFQKKTTKEKPVSEGPVEKTCPNHDQDFGRSRGLAVLFVDRWSAEFCVFVRLFQDTLLKGINQQ